MLLSTACSIAFYCQRCGQIHIQDVPYFCGGEEFTLRCGNCGSELAALRLRPRKGLTVETVCGVCQQKNSWSFDWSRLKKLQFEKIYCRRDSFELGYIGQWQRIAEFLDFNTAEYEALHPGDAYDFIARQQTLLEAMNRVHDLVEKGDLVCPCGSKHFVADIMDDFIILECTDCGSYADIPAASAMDLRRLVPGFRAAFLRSDALQSS